MRMGKRCPKHVEVLSFNDVKVIVKCIKLVSVIKLFYYVCLSLQEYYNIRNYNFACCFVWVWNWWHRLEEERVTTMVQNRAPRKLFPPKMEEIRGSSRKIHSEKLHCLYQWPVLIRRSGLADRNTVQRCSLRYTWPADQDWPLICLLQITLWAAKPRRLRWAGDVARIRKNINT
jgi:hypothetical protein